MKTLLCCIAKNENRYINDWIIYHKNLGFDINDFPNAYNHFQNEITLPLHTCLTGEMENYVISNYVNIVKDYL